MYSRVFNTVTPRFLFPTNFKYANSTRRDLTLRCRIDTAVEIEYVENGGVLHYVLRNLAKAA